MVIDTHQIIAGFSEIKTELRNRTGISKELSVLKLWFSFNHGILCVHDYQDHSRDAMLASYSQEVGRNFVGDSGWKNYLPKGGNGRYLIDYAIWKTNGKDIAVFLNDLFTTHGHYSYFL